MSCTCISFATDKKYKGQYCKHIVSVLLNVFGLDETITKGYFYAKKVNGSLATLCHSINRVPGRYKEVRSTSMLYTLEPSTSTATTTPTTTTTTTTTSTTTTPTTPTTTTTTTTTTPATTTPTTTTRKKRPLTMGNTQNDSDVNSNNNNNSKKKYKSRK
ncbi:hypothetical protein DLAC_09276 [Tieghemostelium lacteum]|uniref:SWIM-type domain-containing protein n=1 Tax=Tieghemostelium lacteum TaxID=361077 RepID=A0A151Z9V0_TIELA|nr:hypothetical protein DLAC_09276 [Tieghemostelium lacteum]|eukprot:KYQ90644.1 hypothetical protein DLAC_09276 [Tieghemostelium lacteum]